MFDLRGNLHWFHHGALAVMLTLLPFQAASAQQKSQEEIEALVQGLGSALFTDREKAAKALYDLGPEAREAVRAVLNSEDPEIRLRSRRLWQSLRWQVIPGAGAEIDAVLEEVKKRQAVNASVWKAFAEKHGAKMLPFLAELREANSKDEITITGLSHLIEVADAKAIGEIVRADKVEAGRKAMINLFDLLQPSLLDVPKTQKIVAIFHEVGAPAKALSVSKRVWLNNEGSQELIQAAVDSVQRGAFEKRVWEDGVKDVSGDEFRLVERSKLVGFYLDLAHALKMEANAAPIVDAVEAEEFGKMASSDRKALVGSLLKYEHLDSARGILAQSKEPIFIYELSRLRENPEEVAEDWKRIRKALDAEKGEEKEDAIYELADYLEEKGDPKAAELWEEILASDPEDSPLDATASIRLGEHFEEAEEWKKSADAFERGLMIMERGGWELSSSDGEDSGDLRAKIEAKIQQFREKSGPSK